MALVIFSAMVPVEGTGGETLVADECVGGATGEDTGAGRGALIIGVSSSVGTACPLATQASLVGGGRDRIHSHDVGSGGCVSGRHRCRCRCCCCYC